MPLKCIAIDDEPPALELIKAYAGRTPELQLVHTFDDAIAGASYLRNASIDLLFVDINMPDITGIDLVRSLQPRPMIIFTTAYKKFAFDGFELEAIDYLLKPIDFERFKKAVNRAVEFHNHRNSLKAETSEHIFVRSEYKLVKIELDSIDYIEGLEDYIKIHIKGSRPVLTLMSLKAILEKLPAEKFIRIHRSYIIPVNGVVAVLNRKVQLPSATLPVSDSYLESLNKLLGK